jgi:hypothetical protein
MVWMGAIWLMVGEPMFGGKEPFAPFNQVPLPPLNSPIERAAFDVWRRWDAVHYLTLAQYGYQAQHPGPTVFGLLTPIGIRWTSLLFAGNLDLGAMVFATATFALALVLLYRLCEVYYSHHQLAKWAVIVVAVFPVSYFCQAPMSEGLYLATVLGTFYAAETRRFWAAAVFGLLATLARSQGVLLVLIILVIALEQLHQGGIPKREWITLVIKRCWTLAIIPLGLVTFLVFRQSQELPSIAEVYRTHSYVFFTDPLSGLWYNFRWFIDNLPDTLLNVDLWVILLTLILSPGLIRQRMKPALIVYTILSILIFLSKINWRWGSYDTITGTQSYARYALALFPLAILTAHWIVRAKRGVRLMYLGISSFLLLFLSQLAALGIGPA